VFGERSAYHTGDLQFLNDNTTVSFNSDKEFNAGERVTVSLSKNVLSQESDSLIGFSWTFRIPSKNKSLNFSEPVEYGGGFNMQCIDMNNDGSTDIVTSSGVILINDGNGEFNSAWYLDDADRFYPIIVDDFNRDRFMDVFYGGAGGLTLGFGNGSGNFNKSYYPWWFNEYISFDINVDGFPDLVGVNNVSNNPPYDTTGYWAISLNNGNGEFTDTIWAGQLTGSFQKLTQSDIDNDGDNDVIIISHLTGQPYPFPFGLNGFVLFKNDGYGVFEEYQIYPCDIYFQVCYPKFIYLSDFNNDGLADIAIIGDSGGAITLNKGNGTLGIGTDTTYLREFWGSEQAAPLSGGDLNGDGWIDLAISGFGIPFDPNEKYYAILQNLNSYFSRDHLSDTIGNSNDFILSNSISDLNNDGFPDIVHSGTGVKITFSNDIIPSVENTSLLPKDFILNQNFPNPFNNLTEIKFQTEKKGIVQISIFNILGEEVKLLQHKEFLPGSYKVLWNGKDNIGRYLPSGVYIIKGNFLKVQRSIKSLLIK